MRADIAIVGAGGGEELGAKVQAGACHLTNPGAPKASRGCGLFHHLQVERDTHAVHQHLTLIDQLLIGDLRICEFLGQISR